MIESWPRNVRAGLPQLSRFVLQPTARYNLESITVNIVRQRRFCTSWLSLYGGGQC